MVYLIIEDERDIDSKGNESVNFPTTTFGSKNCNGPEIVEAFTGEELDGGMNNKQ